MAQSAQRPARQQSRNPSKAANQLGRDHRSGPRRGQSGEATVTYIKRVLCAKPQHAKSVPENPPPDVESEPLEDLLPPLTSSNAVDVQLYALIAVILSNFVQTWYNRITPDQQFVGEIVQIIAHCTRGLEQRLRKIDLESLLLDELSELLLGHVDAVRVAQTPWSRRVDFQGERARYHALRPHMALDPVPLDERTLINQQENEVAWCLLLVNRVLPLLLPPEDLQNPCLDVLVSEVFSELIFHNGVCGKACEPWLIWEGITKALQALRAGGGHAPVGNSSTVNRLEEFGLLAATHASEDRGQLAGPRGRFQLISQTFWALVQAVMTIWFLLWSLTLALMQASSIPARTCRASHRKKTSEVLPKVFAGSTNSPMRAETPVAGKEKQPIVNMHIWGCVSELLSLNRRMPWLSGSMSLLQWVSLSGPGRLCCTNSRLDRLMSFHIHKALLNATWLPSILQAARGAIFPNNVLAAARIPPTSDEVIQIKRACAEAIVEAIPEPVRTRFFATKDRDLMKDDIETELDLLADSYINKNLIVGAVELVAVRLFPELAGDGLLDQRDLA